MVIFFVGLTRNLSQSVIPFLKNLFSEHFGNNFKIQQSQMLMDNNNKMMIKLVGDGNILVNLLDVIIHLRWNNSVSEITLNNLKHAEQQ